jgi:hypothetical protein
MSQIQNNTQQREVIEGRPRQVISQVKIEWLAAKITDSVGNVDVIFATVFGKDPATGEPHIAVINPSELKQMLKIPDPHILKGLRALLKQQSAPVELPEGKVGSFEIGEL